MNAVSLINQLAGQDIRLWLDQGNLRYSAPDGAMTPDLIALLRQYKAQLIEFLQQSEQSISVIPAANYADPLPASFAQQRLWFIQQLEPNNSAYHIHSALRIVGKIDQHRFNQACQAIVARHAILRTTYYQQNGHIFQSIKDTIDWQVSFSAINESELKTAIDAQLHKSFDLSSDTPLRCALFSLDDGSYVASFTVHHIAADGWSLGIFVQELMANYEALGQGNKLNTTPLARQYADYAAWQTSDAQQKLKQQQLQYWQAQLADYQTLDLPLRQARSIDIDNSANIIQRHIPAASIHALNKRFNTTLFVNMMAMFSSLLHRYSQQNDFCIGTPVAGRQSSSLEALIGCFINVLAVRCTPTATQSFSEYLENIKKTCQDALNNQDVPFEQIVQALNVPRDLSITPLFQVMLSVQNAPFAAKDIAGLQISPIESNELTAQFDLKLVVQENDEKLLLAFEYKTALFSKEIIEQLADHFVLLCQAVCEEPNQALHKIALFNDVQLPSLQGKSSNTEKLLPALFAQQAASTPINTAVRCGDVSLSYQDLAAQSDALAQLLISRGIVKGDRIGICLSRRVEVLVALLGAIKAGACYVPMDSSYPVERLQYMLSDADMRFVISEQCLSDRLQNSADKLLLIDELDLSQSISVPLVEIDGDDLLYMIYTSGSTGTPKGAAVYHKSFANLLSWYQAEYSFSARDSSLIISALGFDLTQKNLYALLCCGGTVVLPDTEHYDVARYRQLIKTHAITQLNCAPSAFYPLLEGLNQFDDLASLRTVLFGGEPIRLKALRPWIESEGFKASVVNMYGPTECTDIATSFTATADMLRNWPDEQAIPLGGPSAGVSLYVLDDQLQAVPPGLTGELYIAGISVGAGYWQRPELTAQSFLANPYAKGDADKVLYKTGDRVRLTTLADGSQSLVYLGRKDFQVKLRGLRIELGEIEQALNSLAGIDSSHALVDNEQLLGFVRTESVPENWREALQSKLPAYMLPQMLVPIDAWPLTPNGKIDRKALLALERPEITREYQAPESDVELKLAHIWQQVLGISRIGVNDNFFELGGHSLTAAQAVAIAQQEFAMDLPLRQIFENPTIAAIAALIEQGLLAQQILAGDTEEEDSESFIL